METKQLAAIALVLILIPAAGALAFVTGFGPAPGNGGGGEGGAGEITSFPTASGTPYSGTGGTGEGTATAGNQTTLPPFSFEIVEINKCGQTCRNVTVTLHNNQNHTAHGVSVYTRIYAGNNTQQDNRVWQGTEDVGTLGANESTTSTKHVKLSYSEGYSVKQHDGWVTILTTVKSDNTTITFKNRRDVT